LMITKTAISALALYALHQSILPHTSRTKKVLRIYSIQSGYDQHTQETIRRGIYFDETVQCILNLRVLRAEGNRVTCLA
jgi:hypothetical protein